jgi:hypothetical protein
LPREKKDCPRTARLSARPTPAAFGRAIAVNWFQQTLFIRAGPYYHTINVLAEKARKNFLFVLLGITGPGMV